MDEKIFKKLEAHVFDKGNPWDDIWADGRKVPNALPYFASWALYDDSVTKPPYEQFIRNNITHLNGNIVFAGLNFSKALPPPPMEDWGAWRNIRGDNNVRWLFHGCKEHNAARYKGAYITDIIKNHICPVASKVLEIGREEIEKNINFFFEEIDLLGSDTIEMYLFGAMVEKVFKKYVMRSKKYDAFRKKVKKCQRIDHYSRANTKFRNVAPFQLGLTETPVPPAPPERMILWNDSDN